MLAEPTMGPLRYACVAAAVLACALSTQPISAAEKTPPKPYAGAAVTVVKAKKTCFADTISVSGMLVPREEVLVRPEREGLQISQVLVDAGETVTFGQTLARLAPSDAPQTTTAVQAPVAGIVLKVDAIIGTTASIRAAPLFQIVARGEFELLGELPAKLLSRLSIGQAAKINVTGVGEVTGRVRFIGATVNGAHPARPGPHFHRQRSPPARRLVRSRPGRHRSELRRLDPTCPRCCIPRTLPWLRWSATTASRPGKSSSA